MDENYFGNNEENQNDKQINEPSIEDILNEEFNGRQNDSNETSQFESTEQTNENQPFTGYVNNADFPQYNHLIKEEKKQRSNPKFVLIGVVASVLIVSVLGFGSFTVIKLYENGYIGNTLAEEKKEDDPIANQAPAVNINVTNKPVEDTTDVSADENGKYSTEQIVKLVSPCVVNVVTYTRSPVLTESGAGTGILLSEDGYIITNQHVISEGSSFKVVLNDDREFEAKLVGSDSKTDLAVLKIEATGLTAATFGKSSEAVIGEEVIAIGNSAGLSGSITKGIISQLDRQVLSGALDMIQTDAAVNPGNSGGPLVNMYGQIIGITSSKYVGTGYEGIGFAISIDEAIPIVEQLMQYGYVKDRAQIGIKYTLLTETVANMYGIEPGLYVKSIDNDCYVSGSDLQLYDIITKIDGVEMTSANSITQALNGKKPGDTVKLTVYRMSTTSTSGKTLEIEVKLSEDKGDTDDLVNNSNQYDSNSDNYSYYYNW